MKLGFAFFLTLCIVFLCSACAEVKENREYMDHSTEMIQGTLYFKSVNIFGPTGISDSAFDRLMDAARNADARVNNEMINALQHLRAEGLTRKPSFRIQTEPQKIITVFVEEQEYEKIKNFSLNDLRKNQEKVDLKLKGRRVLNSFFDCQEITSVEVVPGSTPWMK